MVHNQTRGVDNAAADEPAEYPIFRNDQMREPMYRVPCGHQESDHRDYD
jgi:hypothetical protein